MFDNDKNQRKYQCFVCGRYFLSLEEYKNHIIETHEEGREYITCPACGFPVRDLPMHFRVKHKNRTMPKNCQTKVGVWKDFSSNGKSRTRKPKFRQGWFVSNKMNGKKFKYRSSWECEVFECLEEDLDVNAYYVEPFSVDYYWKNKWRKYFPDILVEYTNGLKEIIEIKPANQTTLKQNHAKWNCIQEHVEKHGWDFQVMTEKGIQKLKLKVKNQRNQ